MTENPEASVTFVRTPGARLWLVFNPSSNRWLVEVVVRDEGGIYYLEKEYPTELVNIALLIRDAREQGFSSIRPFTLGDSVDPSMHYSVLGLFLTFCEQHSLDAVALMRDACSNDPAHPKIDFEFVRLQSQWEGMVIPSAWSPSLISELLEALSDIGCDSLAAVLEAKVTRLS